MSVANAGRIQRKVTANSAIEWAEDDTMRIKDAYFWRRNVLERGAAALLLVPGLPAILALALLVRLTSRGPGIYSQARVGRNGKQYVMYKLRSMRVDAEAAEGPTWSSGDDPRITPFGRILRKTHLDELPQLFNVFRGEMSLIGPRPERPEFVEILAKEIPGYLDRLAVLPGVTGLAQINLPPDNDLNCVRRKLVLDRQYIEAAGVWLDLRIMLCTVLRMLGFSGFRTVTAFGLHRTVKLDSDAAPAAAESSPCRQVAVKTLAKSLAEPQPPTHQQPTHQQPIHQQPIHQQPIHQQPIHQQPAHQQPIHQQPVHQPVVQLDMRHESDGGNGQPKTSAGSIEPVARKPR